MMPTNASADACTFAITNAHADIYFCNNACADDAYTFTNTSANASADASADASANALPLPMLMLVPSPPPMPVGTTPLPITLPTVMPITLRGQLPKNSGALIYCFIC